jgi:methyltransferase (TIGR00027 family)
MALHQVLRKRWLEQAVEQALAEGVRQVVVLGGGLDTLAARLARRHPSVHFLEADHPATQAVKRTALERAGYLGPNFSLAAMDFNRWTLGEALRARPEFRLDAPSLFLCEGVLMYLDPAAVDSLFAGLAALTCPSLRFAFTYMEPGPDGSIAFAGSRPVVKAWLRWRKEAFTWGLPRGGLEAFLASRGFALDRAADDSTLRELFLADGMAERIASGEKLALATRGAASGAE